MTMTLVKLRYNSKLVPDPGLVLQTPLCKESATKTIKLKTNLVCSRNCVLIISEYLQKRKSYKTNRGNLAIKQRT